MKKFVAIALALSLMATPASAITTGNWDMGAAGQSAASAATRLWQEEQKQEDAPEQDRPCLPRWILELWHMGWRGFVSAARCGLPVQ